MTRLGDALEAVHDSRHRFTTVRATGRAGEGVWRIWWQRPDRIRTEHDDEVTVRVGSQWWRWSPRDGATTNHGDEHYHVGPVPLEHLLDPTPLLACALEVVGEGEIAGRPVVHLRARPTPARRDAMCGTWSLEGELDVAIDLETGAALQAGEVTLLEVAFEEDFPASVFAVPFPAGVEPRSEEKLSPRELLLEEARALVPFSVLLPTLLPEGARLSGCLLAPDDPPGWLGLTYVIDPGARNSLHIQQGPSVALGAEDLVAWEHAMVDDVELRIQERGGEGFHTVEVFLTREGVPLLAHSDLDRGALVAIALSLERA